MGKLLFCCLFVLFSSGFVSSEFCAGCPQEQDPENPEFYKLINSYLLRQNSDDVVSKVLRVTTQVVSGIKYSIDFTTSSNLNNEEKICTLNYVSQPWISKDPLILDFKCKPYKRQSKFVGGLKDIDISSEKQLVSKLGDAFIKTINEIDPKTTRNAIVNITEAKKQIVNGIMYHMTFVIKSTSCDENREVNDECLAEETGPRKICKTTLHSSFSESSAFTAKLVSSLCTPVEEHLLGLPASVAVNDIYIKEVADFAVERLNQMSNSIYVKKLVKIIDAKTQLVNGMKVDLTLELANTECTKSHQQSLKETKECKFLDSYKDTTICHVSVLEQKKSKKLVGSHCDSPQKIVKRSVALGGESEIDINDSRIQNLIGYIGHELTQRANSPYTKHVVKIYNAPSSQIVSGTFTKAEVEVADTDCLKTENLPPNQCKTSQKGRQICTVVIWEQPWLNKKEITQSECHSIETTPAKLRRRRMAELVGADENDKDLNDFLSFVQTEKKIYKNKDELNNRFRIFRANMKKAAILQQHEQGTATYGATKFADLTAKEFKKYLGYNYNPSESPKKPLKMAEIPNVSLPESFDWREHGAVTPVKNQGACGSCWAFSVTGNVEGLYAIQNGTLLSFSEQELVDCDKYDGGCEGGLFDTAYRAIEDLGGLETEKDYPYHARGEKCHLDSSEIKVKISGGLNISHDETDMAKYLLANGPISIAINANAMQFYFGGVSHPLKFLCNPKQLDHGVLIVGYGVHKGWITKRMLPYWLVKNSWGPSWGHQGYYMVYRGDGTCGLNQAVSTAVL